MTSGMTGTEAPPRLLAFFPRGASSDAIREGLSSIQSAASKEVLLVDSLAWYDNRFAACGDWDSWALEAVTGKSYRTREPYFHGFVLTGEGRVGQGTAKVASLAISMKKPVYWLTRGQLKPVASVEPAQGSWRISTGEAPL